MTAENPFPFQDTYAVANGAGNPISPLWCIRREDGNLDLPEGCTFDVTDIRDPLGAIESLHASTISSSTVRVASSEPGGLYPEYAYRGRAGQVSPIIAPS